MAFKMKGFPMHKGISPMRNLKDDPSNQKDAFDSSPGNYDTPTAITPTKTEEVVEEEESGTSAGDLSNIMKTHFNDKDKKIKTSNGKNLGIDLEDNKKAEETEELKKQSKKEMYANAWQNSGAGHIVEAVKSIRRGIKNIKDKKSAKKAEKLASAKTAVGSGSETLKQAKVVERNRNKTDKKAKKEIEKAKKDKLKLAKYREKNPVRGKEAIKLLDTQTKKTGPPFLGDRKKKKETKRKIKELKKSTITKDGETYDKSKPKVDYSTYTTEELMKRREDKNYRKPK